MLTKILKMKYFFFLILVFLSNCSFDDKTGIWKSENIILNKEKDKFKNFETLSNKEILFSKIIRIDPNFKFDLPKKTVPKNWKDIYYNSGNNTDNFEYKNLNNLLFKSKKISKYKVNDRILYADNKIISSDDKGNILLFSINEEILEKYNFYKRKYKNIKKKLYMAVDENTVYVADNIGYLYAYDFSTLRIKWAKNYKIPFRSNIKIVNNKIAAANQNNILYFFNKKNGDILKTIPTEETLVKNNFENNISFKENSIFFLNTYGTLYSVNEENLKINWLINLNRSIDINPSNLFSGQEMLVSQNKIIVSSINSTFVIDANTGSILYKFNINSTVKPILMNNYLFTVSNDLLICLDITNFNIIYSNDINKLISDFLKIKKNKKKIISPLEIFIVNSDLYLFLKNSHVLKFNIYGELKNIDKFKNKISTNPIFINKNLIYISNKNKISVFD